MSQAPQSVMAKGFSATFSFRFNPTSSNPLVKMLSIVLSGSFVITFSMNEKEVYFALMLPDVTLSNSCTMKQLRMFMNIAFDAPIVKFGLGVNFVTVVSGQTLNFGGAITVNVADQSVSVKISMI